MTTEIVSFDSSNIKNNRSIVGFGKKDWIDNNVQLAVTKIIGWFLDNAINKYINSQASFIIHIIFLLKLMLV